MLLIIIEAGIPKHFRQFNSMWRRLQLRNAVSDDFRDRVLPPFSYPSILHTTSLTSPHSPHPPRNPRIQKYVSQAFPIPFPTASNYWLSTATPQHHLLGEFSSKLSILSSIGSGTMQTSTDQLIQDLKHIRTELRKCGSLFPAVSIDIITCCW